MPNIRLSLAKIFQILLSWKTDNTYKIFKLLFLLEKCIKRFNKLMMFLGSESVAIDRLSLIILALFYEETKLLYFSILLLLLA